MKNEKNVSQYNMFTNINRKTRYNEKDRKKIQVCECRYVFPND